MRFRDSAYYHDGLYVSYHLMDPKSGDFIQFENARIKVPQPSNHVSAEVETDISLDGFDEYQRLILQFDLVDESNAFWLSNKEQNMQMPEVIYINDVWKGMASKVKNEIVNAPVIFGINIMITCVFVAIAEMIKRKKII